MGIQLNGYSIPWAVLVFVCTVIGTSAVIVYKVSQIEEAHRKHVEVGAHQHAENRITILEESRKHKERRLDQIEDRQKNLSHRIRQLEGRKNE